MKDFPYLTAGKVARIDAAVSTGIYSSRSGFLVDAARNSLR